MKCPDIMTRPRPVDQEDSSLVFIDDGEQLSLRLRAGQYQTLVKIDCIQTVLFILLVKSSEQRYNAIFG